MIDYFLQKIHRLYKYLETRDHELRYLFLEITKRCNLRCRHCGSDCCSSISAKELTTDSWLKIIDYVKDTFGQNVAFIITGGEPLIHPELERIGKHITMNNMRWGIVTNGMSLTEKKLGNLIDIGIYSVTVSYDGNKKSHNYLRGVYNAHERASAAVRLIAKSSIEMKDVVTCVYPQNLEELDEIADFFLQYGITAWRLFRIFPNGRAADNPELLMDHEQTWRMLNWISEKKDYYKNKGLYINASCEGWIPFNIDRKVRDMPFFCRAGINIAAILSDGTITGCTNNHTAFHQGSIITESFSNIWENKFSDYRTREWIKDTGCARCKYIKNCQGGSLHLWKSKTRNPEFCYMNNIRF